MTIGGQPFEVTQPGVPCSFSISGTNPVQPAPGGTGAFNIAAAGPACDWVASSNADWLTVTSPPSGTGDGSVSFSAATNGNPTSRSGTLTIAGQNVVVTQSGIVCSYSLRSPGADVSPTGGQNSLGVLAATGCPWSAAVAPSSESWIHLGSGTPGSGAGTVYYTVDPNSGNSDRSGAITIANQTFVVTQPAPPCTYTIDPVSGSVGSGAALGSFAFSGAGSGCNAVPVSTSNWIAITSATGGSVSFTIASNPSGAARSGNIILGDANYVVEQAGAACGYTLDSLGASFGRLGGDGSVTVTASPPAGCVPVVNSTPPLVRSGLTGGPAVYSQGYYVPSYQSVINWVRTMAIDFSGQDFTVKQSSW